MISEEIVSSAIETGKSLIGVKEEKPNRGSIIDEIQQFFGFLGVQYCVLFVLYLYAKAFLKYGKRNPFPKTASSQTLADWAIKNGFAYTDPKLLQPGDIIIFRKFKLWQGHAGLVISCIDKDNNFRTIEGNTSNNNFGSQNDGDGIFKRIRTARKLDFAVDGFYIRCFINVRKVLQTIK